MGPLPNGDKILALGDQAETEGVLLEESLAEILPSLDHGHVKGSEPLERGPSQTLLEKANQEPFISLKLTMVSAVGP